MRDYDRLLDARGSAQPEKLRMNEHKKGFDDVDFVHRLKRIKEEFYELSAVVQKHSLLGGYYEEIRQEAADIAYKAYLVVLNCDKELEK